jgi:phosphoribosylglycinamide formyltransferase-1
MRVGVLVSGTGTNLQALLDAQAHGTLAPAEIAVVLSNKRGAPALVRADAAGVPAEVIEHDGLERVEFERRLIDALDRHRATAVVLAGFMRVLTAHFIDRFPLRIVNTHPSLLPAFPGIDAPAQAIADGDDARTLHARIQREEHRLLPIVVRRLAAGELSCQGRHVRGRAE